MFSEKHAHLNFWLLPVRVAQNNFNEILTNMSVLSLEQLCKELCLRRLCFVWLFWAGPITFIKLSNYLSVYSVEKGQYAEMSLNFKYEV